MSQVLTTKYRTNYRPSPPLAQTSLYTWLDGEWIFNSSVPTTPDVVALSGVYESLTSVGHRGPPYKEGGPFQLKRYSFSIESAQVTLPPVIGYPLSYGNGNFKYEYSGVTTIDPYILPIVGGMIIPTSVEDFKTRHDAISFPSIDLNTYGAQAIDRFSPLSKGVDMGQFLAELRDLPRLPGRMLAKLDGFRNLGSEYLNAQFGWAPFLSDLQGMYHTYMGLNKRMAQIVRDNGLPVRRTGTLQNNITSTLSEVASSHSIWPQPQQWTPEYDDGANKSAMTTRTSTRIWYVGRMRYYLPFDTSNEWPLSAKAALFGLNPTPSLLYQVIPWSWLIDWFSNLGEVISNASSNGLADLIHDYGYCMRHVKTETVATVKYPSRFTFGQEGVQKSTSGPYSTLRAIALEETKERVAASPFGFGLQIDDLSVRQLAILSALGLSRSNL